MADESVARRARRCGQRRRLLRSADKDGALAFLEGKIAKWWTPDDVLFVDELPHTATGKLYKSVLREKYKDYVLPTA